MINPPNFADLAWTQNGSRFEAADTEQFRAIYRTARDRLFRIGIRSEAIGGVWQAIFTPKYSRPDIQLVIDAMLVEVAGVQERIDATRIAAEARRLEADRIRDEERARWLAEHAAFVAERLPGAITDARRCLAQFGEFVVRKDRMRELVQRHDRKSRCMFSKIAAMTGDFSYWPQNDIVDAIESLTLADAGMASIESKRGWSKADSPGGHWTYAMLQRGDAEGRDAAIKLGRALVGMYAATQLGRAA